MVPLQNDDGRVSARHGVQIGRPLQARRITGKVRQYVMGRSFAAITTAAQPIYGVPYENGPAADWEGMSRWMQWWLDDDGPGDWELPAARLQGFRLIGGAIVGTPDRLRFVPNRLEARFGGRAQDIPRSAITAATMGRRMLRITTTGGLPQTFFINRRGTALSLLASVLTPA